MTCAGDSMILSLLKARCARHGGNSYRSFITVQKQKTFRDISDEYGCENTACTIEMASMETGPWTSVQHAMFDQPVSGIVGGFDYKFIKLTCKGREEDEELQPTRSKKPKVNAFEVLMSSSKSAPVLPKHKEKSSGVKEGISRKDQLYNDLIDLMETKQQHFTDESEGKYVVEVLRNALWYITNQHEVLHDAALRHADLKEVPSDFQQFDGYDEHRRQKLKQNHMKGSELKGHAEALFSLCTRASVNQLQYLLDQTIALATCLQKYSEYLENKNREVKTNQSLENPVRQVAKNTTVTHVEKTGHVSPEYRLLDEKMKNVELLEPVFFDEAEDIDTPFQSAYNRFRFFQLLKLSYPIDLYKYSPGGGILTLHCLVKVEEKRSDTTKMNNTAAIIAEIKPKLPEFHTRQMKKIFRQKLSNVASVQPAVADLIYKELSLDPSAAAHPETQERIRLIFLGEVGLLTDMRKMNTGRKTGEFDEFFQHVGAIIEEVVAADERRHNVAHLSEWLSLKDLMQQATERCSEEASIPSKDLVRIQFTPRNPYCHAALNFTSKFEVQYKIQRRQLRSSHIDAHYCAAILKYIKEYAVMLNAEECSVFFCDDKAKVHVGEPGVAASTGVRGKKSLVPIQTTLAAADHDLNQKACLVPSVFLQCKVPETAEKSFYRGTVTVTVNDAVFQPSTPFRHAATIVQEVKASGNTPNVLIKYTDGGTDHRNTLEAVKCASICIFKELDLDLYIGARCAPGQSWSNPAERVMSILNIGLQNVALERDKTDDDAEFALKRCNSMADIRKAGEVKPHVRQQWTQSIRSPKQKVTERFQRLALKEEKIRVVDTVKNEEVDGLKSHLTELFPNLDHKKLVKAHTQKVPEYNKWMDRHCLQHTYMFQIQKCDDPECCSPRKSNPPLLPAPQLDSTGQHYKALKDVLGLEITNEDQPSLKLQTDVKERSNLKGKEAKKQAIEKPSNKTTGSTSSIPLTAQTTRLLVECVECRKKRVVYCQRNLSERQKISFAKLVSEFDFTCGSPITPPDHNLHDVVVVRIGMTCQSPMETPYYGSQLGRWDICYFCGGEDAERDRSLLEKYKSVYPLCKDCVNAGYKPYCMRPYGKK